MPETFAALSHRARGLVNRVGWQVYHTPENLTLFLLGEAAELGEYCQWLSEDEIREPRFIEGVSAEIADVIKNVLYLTNVLPLTVSLEALISEKIRLDEEKYPLEGSQDSRFQVEERERRKKNPPPLPQREPETAPSVADIQRMSWEFVTRRGWQEFYTPASLALSIAIKSGEVATCYQRRHKPILFSYERLMWALAVFT